METSVEHAYNFFSGLKKYKEEWEVIADDLYSGQHCMSKTDTNIEEVSELTPKNH